jgi:hypothetical protein
VLEADITLVEAVPEVELGHGQLVLVGEERATGDSHEPSLLQAVASNS